MPAARKPAPADSAPADTAVVALDAAVVEDAPVEDADTTTDYTRRAGGYVLTDRGWTLEPPDTADDQDSED
ncbi:hypothetical protein [Amycolatopsis sp. H20-H5]|uniref:hypothetical protein n=1 Tax=Amycolatopsis sp. H20-H5 TaxID=3046309 RepID=UPI002DB98B3C|nr:hypothetical protein [Amycolatopsis sp. H20-H5]MEC3975092.1 hypothetical protein [Amycolatopsis sp. H20-H5]